MCAYRQDGGATGTITQNDVLIGGTANALASVAPGNLPSFLIQNSSGVPVWSNTSGGPDIIFYQDDLVYGYENAGTLVGVFGLQPGNNGTAASSLIVNSIATHPGIWQLTTGTTTTGIATLGNANNYLNCFLPGGGYSEFNYLVQLPVLSNGTDTYTFWVGLSENGGVYASYPGNNACWFKYLSSSSLNWSAETIASGTPTVASGGSSVAVTTGWNHLRITINAAGTSVSFYVNGTLIGTSASNIPTSQSVGIQFALIKSAGTTSVVGNIDYISFYQQLTTSRF
jgi:hypothetical protein